MKVQWQRERHAHPASLQSRSATTARRTPFRRYWLILSVLVLIEAAGCTPIADDSKLPPNVQDPAMLHTPAGALELYHSSLLLVPGALEEVMVKSAIFTDELAALPVPFGVTGTYTGLDSRLQPAGSGDIAYKRLHQLRAQLREARGFLASYATDTATARELRGHLYAAEGYADVLLADLFCSGIPLGTVDFQGDYTLAAGSTTREVYRRAVGLFDSALTLLRDSVTFRRMAAVGRGRALLAIGVYDSAAQAVADVPTEYRYQVTTIDPREAWTMWGFALGGLNVGGNYATVPGIPGVGHNEGQNGLDYLATDDPRVGGTPLGEGFYFHSMYYFPTKYTPVEPTVALTMADGIEARLIEAEAALQQGSDNWLTILNQLRTSGSVTKADTLSDTLGVTDCGPVICGNSPGGSDPAFGQPAGGFPVPAGYTLADSFTIDPLPQAIYDDCYNNSWYEPCYVDLNAPQPGRTTVYVYTTPTRTRWLVGAGGVEGLEALADPNSGTPAGPTPARVDLLFRERAFWLYLTAHRQGDMRRLIRQYGRAPERVYPTGTYPGGTGAYGTEVVVPVPESERQFNALYSGCINYGA